MPKTPPTGETHEVSPQDMFFSTTDARGVIEQANSVFVRLARHELTELVGAPHNIIRHPDMPGGAFRLTWDMLKAGAPTCAYVKNLAGDGSTYWAFATIVPVADGFLSVRTRPCREDLQHTADLIYLSVRNQELAARLEGRSAADSAEHGAQLIEGALRSAGFASYLDFILSVLPAEVEARAALGVGIPERPDATGPLADMLTSVRAIKAIVDHLAGELEGFQGQAESLNTHVAKASDVVATMDSVLDAATVTVVQNAARGPVLASSLPALHAQNDTALNSMRALHDHVEDVRMRRAELRFSVALSQLQAEAVGRFVVELIDDAGGGTDAQHAIRDLVAALDFGLSYLAHDLRWNVDMAASMSNEIGFAREAFAQMRSLVAHWRLLVARYDLGAEMADHMPLMDATLAAGVTELGSLAAEAGLFTTAAVGFDSALLMQELGNVTAKMAQWADPQQVLDVPEPAQL